MANKKSYSNIDIVITGNVACRKELSWTVRILYGLIRGLTRNDYYCCYASNEYLCERMEKGNASTVGRYLKKLEEIGVVKREPNAYIFDERGKIQRVRAVILTELYDKFKKKQDVMLDLKGSIKNRDKVCKIAQADLCNSAYQSINMYPCKENNKFITNNKVRDNPQTPLQGGEQAATLVETERLEVLGKFGNVRLTKSQKAGLIGEFGESFTLALIEQLSAYIQSGVRRIRKKADYYAMLRDWALRRKEQQVQTQQTTTSDTTDEDITGGTLL